MIYKRAKCIHFHKNRKNYFLLFIAVLMFILHSEFKSICDFISVMPFDSTFLRLTRALSIFQRIRYSLKEVNAKRHIEFMFRSLLSLYARSKRFL